jgi:hypothetical protein
LIWYYQEPVFIARLHLRGSRVKMILMMFYAKKGFRSLLLLYVFTATSFLGWTHKGKEVFFLLFSSKIEFYNLICIFNRAILFYFVECVPRDMENDF